MPAVAGRRLRAIDTLRGVAALGVCAGHAIVVGPFPPGTPLPIVDALLALSRVLHLRGRARRRHRAAARVPIVRGGAGVGRCGRRHPAAGRRRLGPRVFHSCQRVRRTGTAQAMAGRRRIALDRGDWPDVLLPLSRAPAGADVASVVVAPDRSCDDAVAVRASNRRPRRGEPGRRPGLLPSDRVARPFRATSRGAGAIISAA